MTPRMLAGLLAAREEGRAAVLATRLRDGAQMLLPEQAAPVPLQDAASLALARDESRMAEIEGEDWFLHVQAPPHRLIVVGAVHVAQALVALAAPLGMLLTVVDPRAAFATDERFPGVALSQAWPDEALDALGLDARCAVVMLSHDPKLDDPALDRALRSRAFYIGALGSRKSHAARLARLAELGHGEEQLARIRGPVGLALGAATTAEIALSILAEIVAVRRGALLGIRA